MKDARLENGEQAFPIFSKTGDKGKAVKLKRGDVPSFHSFRHSVASEAFDGGDDAEEISWLLRHKDSTVTRRVYLHEIKSRERSIKRRSKLEARIGSKLSDLGSAHGRAAPNRKRHSRTPQTAEVVELSARRIRTA